MPEDRLESIKTEVRSVIITYPQGVTLNTFLRAYKQLLGVRLPSREFGYTSDIDFLYSLTDVVRIITDKNGEYELRCIADKTTEHIQKLVGKQRITKPRSKNIFNHNGNTVVANRFKGKPFVSASLRKCLFEILSDYPDGISYHSLLVAYQKKLKRPLNLDFLSENHHDRLEILASAVSELEIKDVNETKRLFYFPNRRAMDNTTNMWEGNCSSRSIGKTFTLKESVKHESNEQTTDISVVPKVVKNNFEEVLKRYPDGVLAKYFPILYEKTSGEIFDILDLGYNNFLELAHALPDIFICVKPYASPNDWVLFHPSFSNNANHFKDVNTALETSAKQFKDFSKTNNINIPADIAPLSLSYTQPEFPSDVNLTKYIPVFISATVSPSLFWFKLQLDEVICRFRELEDHLQIFYHSCSGEAYKMSESDVKVDTACVAVHEDHWYRVIIASPPSYELVNVYFVDYGSWEQVSCSDLRYLKYSFITLPAQAFKAQLASVKPLNNAGTWSKNAESRFLQLCDTPFIMAKVQLEFDDSVSVLLCDTSGVEDIHINDTLVDEGLVDKRIIDSYQLNHLGENDQNLRTNDISSTSWCSESPSSNERDSFLQELSPIQNELLEKQKYVKRISVSDGYKFHILAVSMAPYITASELCNLFWQNKPSELLKERLELKNVIIPTISISKEEYRQLFQQCEDYAVQGFQEASQPQYSVVLYPLVFIMKVLNTWGHPSVKVREIIKTELEHFDFSNKEWNQEFSDSVDELDEISKGNHDDLNRLCLYDLKALQGAIKCKRIKLQISRKETNYDTIQEELQKIETLDGIIKTRIELIKSICMSYSCYENQ